MPMRSLLRAAGSAGHPASTDRPSWARKQDGQWLAEALGIDPAVLATVPGAADTDQAEARAAKTALWPATWGYFLATMLHPIFTDRGVESARAFFTSYVSGRGLLPALRIGRQPYGILPITVLSRLAPVPAPGDELLDAKALQLIAQLTGQIDGRVATAGRGGAALGAGGDPQQTLLDVLALHPASVEFHQRYAESLEDMFNRFAFDGMSARLFAVFEALLTAARARDLLSRLGWQGADPDMLTGCSTARSTGCWARWWTTGRCRRLSRCAPIPMTAGTTCSGWPTPHARSLDMLRREQGFSGDRRPTALLYMLLRHALLLSWWDTGLRLRLEAGVIDVEALQRARREQAFVHIAVAGDSESRYQALYMPEPRVTGDERASVADVIPRRLGERAGRHLADTIAAVERLSGLPTARLERLLAEHLDCCSHRLDAWRLGLVHHRLLALREVRDGQPGTARRGIHLGAYAWLEEVRPEPRALSAFPLDPELAAALDVPPGATLLRDAMNGGYVHAPSLNHATTAAVLRSGYLANATPAQPDLMAVNISSERMRLAKSVLEGIRNGQTLGALLGYRLERGLHDRHALAEVDHLIHELRRVFPAPGDRDGRQAIDGLDLVTPHPCDGHPHLSLRPRGPARRDQCGGGGGGP